VRVEVHGCGLFTVQGEGIWPGILHTSGGRCGEVGETEDIVSNRAHAVRGGALAGESGEVIWTRSRRQERVVYVMQSTSAR
jgi:hypothetical protein